MEDFFKNQSSISEVTDAVYVDLKNLKQYLTDITILVAVQ
jgi:hypothetical protein